jgi:hypothetical protein
VSTHCGLFFVCPRPHEWGPIDRWAHKVPRTAVGGEGTQRRKGFEGGIKKKENLILPERDRPFVEHVSCG